MAPAEPAATVIPLGGGISLGEAATAFLARRDLDADTLRSYAQTMTVLVRELGEATPASAITGEQVAATAAKAWEHVAARTWNRHRAAFRSFSTWAAGAGRGYLTSDLAAVLDRRPEPADRTRVISRHQIDALWNRRDIPLREKTLWRLLYESAGPRRLGAGVGHRRPRPARQTRQDHRQGQRGPLGAVAIRHRPTAAPPDQRPHQRAAISGSPPARPRPHTGGGRHLPAHRPGPPVLHSGRIPVQKGHRRRHLAPAAALPADPPRRRRLVPPMLMALSGHDNLLTLGIYVHPSAEAVAAALARQDPGRRH